MDSLLSYLLPKVVVASLQQSRKDLVEDLASQKSVRILVVFPLGSVVEAVVAGFLLSRKEACNCCYFVLYPRRKTN